jgi:hypothetical protein
MNADKWSVALGLINAGIACYTRNLPYLCMSVAYTIKSLRT